MKKVFFAAVLSACLLTGCVSSGNQSLKNETEQSVAAKIVKGVTTKNEIRALFGSPISVSFTPDGKEIWTYQFDKAHVDAVSLIPIVNAFGQSQSGTRKQLVILFDQHDKVFRYAMSESQVKTGSGIFQ